MASAMVGSSTSGVGRSASSGAEVLKRHFRSVVGYNWLVAISITPLAFSAAFILSVMLPEALRPAPWLPPPISVSCVAAYIWFEVTAFCLERNWSGVSFWRFWRFAAPLAALQAFLCLKFARNDVLTCLLFMSLCLGLRETLFEMMSHCSDLAKSASFEEQVIQSLLGGSTYGMLAALLCGVMGSLTYAVVGDGRQVFSTLLIEVLCGVALPCARNISRLLLNQIMSNVAIPALPLSADSPKLDALVIYSDVLFIMTMFLEVPFAFIFLLVPKTVTFILALVVNVLLDMLFVQALDVMQKRNMMYVAWAPPPLKDDTVVDLSGWSPTYCIERPESIWTTMASGTLLQGPSETTSLFQTPHALSPDDSARTCGCPLEMQRTANDCLLRFPTCWRISWKLQLACSRCRQWLCPSKPPESEPMSPRVSLLLEEHNVGVIECWAGRTAPRGGSGLFAYLCQQRKIAINTHVLCCTLALVLVVAALPVAKHASDHNKTEFLTLHHITADELAIRACCALVLRVVADLVALHFVELSKGPEWPSWWLGTSYHSRQEFGSAHGWFYRALASTCPLFIVIAATL